MKKPDRRTRTHHGTAQALRDLIRAEMAHERAVTDEVAARELEAQLEQARANYRRLTGADA